MVPTLLSSAVHHVYPTGQPLVYGDLGNSTIGVNPYLHQDAPNLFGLPAPVHPGTEQARAPCIDQQLRCTQEALPRLELTRAGQTLFYETNVWLTMKPDSGIKVWFRRS